MRNHPMKKELFFFVSFRRILCCFSCHSSHILAFCPNYLVYYHIYTTFAVAIIILNDEDRKNNPSSLA